jgi:glycosyltransferase 2 family protein
MRSKIIDVLKLLFTPLAFAFLLYFAWQSKDELMQLISSASLLYLCLAAIVWGLSHALSPVLAVVVFEACGSKVSWKQAFATHAARLPARYLPGGIWHTVGRVMDYREQGVKSRHLTAFVILENGLAAAVTLAVGGAIVFSTRGMDPLGSIAGLASVAGFVAVPAIGFLTNSRVLQSPDRLSVVAYSKSTAAILLFWAGATLAFLLYLSAFPSTALEYSYIEMAGIYLFSWGVGFIAVFAPQGIGVFELVASELMAGPIGFMGLAALIAGFRVVVLVADVLVWFVYQAMRRAAD